MPRKTFQQLFKLIDRDTIRVLQKLKIGSFEIDEGAEIDKGVTFAGIDLFNYLDADFDGEVVNGAFVIKHIYPNG